MFYIIINIKMVFKIKMLRSDTRASLVNDLLGMLDKNDLKRKEFNEYVYNIRILHGDEALKYILNEVLYLALFENKAQINPRIILRSSGALRSNGADVNCIIKTDIENGTLLFLAIAFKRWNLLDRLILSGADIPVITQNINGVLLSSFENGQFTFFNKLITQLSDVSCLPEGPVFLKNLLTNLPKEFECEMMEHLIQFFCDVPFMHDSIRNIKVIYENDISLFRAVVNNHLDIKYKDFLNKAMVHDFPSYYKYISPFGCGRGKIDYESILTACAAIFATKKQGDITFNPTVLNGEGELQEYFEFINDGLTLIDNKSHKFIVRNDLHWISGVVDIKCRNITIFFVDSLGDESTYSKELSKIATNVFNPVSALIELKVIISKQERQRRQKGCSIFALDDVRKLFKITDISEDLNPSMLRTTDSQIIIETEKARSDTAQLYFMPVNKRGMFFDESWKMHLKPEPDNPENIINTRIDHKLQKLCEKVTDFVSNKSEDEIELAKKKFNLSAFKIG